MYSKGVVPRGRHDIVTVRREDSYDHSKILKQNSLEAVTITCAVKPNVSRVEMVANVVELLLELFE